MSRCRKPSEARFSVRRKEVGSRRKYGRKASEACTYNSPIPPKGFRLRFRRVVSLNFKRERRGA